MPDSLAFVPIVNGNTITVTGLYNQTTQSGTVAIMPLIELWANGGTVGTSAPLPMLDSSALINTGSIVSSNAAIQASVSSMATALTGTLLVAPALTPVALDSSTVTTAGTAVNALNAGHAVKGGVLFNPNSFPIFYAQIGTAGTVASGNTYSIAAGSTAGLFPSTAAVSVNSGTSATVFSGNGFT